MQTPGDFCCLGSSDFDDRHCFCRGIKERDDKFMPMFGIPSGTSASNQHYPEFTYKSGVELCYCCFDSICIKIFRSNWYGHVSYHYTWGNYIDGFKNVDDYD
uniref:uncharacterized protein LOC120337096 n=1 Tax=Styela clava TaxID=7725 RepID=UPI00193A22C6|nr:uncharacterized protein LOC120337096 [Styela clava]